MKQVSVSLLKLGGSIITDKRRGRPVIRRGLVRRFARELGRVRGTQPARRFIVLLGGGSFGHPLAHRYDLVNQPLDARRLAGFGRTTNAMRELTTQVAGICLAAGLPVIPLQTSAMVSQRGRRLIFSGFSQFRTILEAAGIPLLAGDVVLADRGRVTIASADALAAALARRFPAAQLFFATDVDGVYGSYPPPRGATPLPRIRRARLRVLVAGGSAAVTKRDVTGGMVGKLRALLTLRNRTAVIFNGRKRGVFTEVFRGRHLGTTITV